jgi:pimeloyl-ACP methyl ester carboxylesterase
LQQQIQYCTTSDGVRLAYSIIGAGTPIVRTPHWMAHLEKDLEGPLFRHQILGLAHHHSLLRYDGRGLGLSQRDVPEISFERSVSDLETIIEHVGLKRFILVGLSQGGAVAITYASRHPDRVSHLIVYGAFARGFLHRGDLEKQKADYELSRALVRQGWGSDLDSYRAFFTTQFVPDGTLEHHRFLNDIERLTATPEVAERILTISANVNVVDVLPKVRVPTLVLHARDDIRIPFSCGQEIAAGISGAKLVPLESRNHIILGSEPANRAFFDAIADFVGDKRIRGALPGTTTFKERAQKRVAALERFWLIKVIAILAALAGAAISFVQLYRLLKI